MVELILLLHIVAIAVGVAKIFDKIKSGSNKIPEPNNKLPPSVFLHGTTMENALEIYNTGLWLVAENTPDSYPKGVYLTDNIEIAKGYSKKSGAIIPIDVKPGTKLTKVKKGYYVYEIPDAKEGKEYYQIRALKPIGIISPDGKKIK